MKRRDDNVNLPIVQRSEEAQRINYKEFGAGMRIAYRPDTVDERTIEPWREKLSDPVDLFQIDPGGTILDVGAHIGAFAMMAAKRSPGCRILAIEPCRESYELLVRNIRMNRLARVEAARVALADRDGEVRLYYSPTGNWGHSITKASAGGSERVPAKALQTLLKEHDIDCCDLAKFNCEGAEFPILTTASAKTLRKIKQMLILYHLDMIDAPYGLEALEGHLAAAGFETKRQENSEIRGFIVAHSRVEKRG